MAKYLVLISGAEGCDYSPVGCGASWEFVDYDGDDFFDHFVRREAFEGRRVVGVGEHGELVDADGGEVCFMWDGEATPEKMIIVPVAEFHAVDIQSVVQKVDELRAAAEQRAQDAKDAAEFQRLSKKFAK